MITILPDDLSSISIAFDATITEVHESTATVTEHPVETGSNIADHVRVDPQSLSCEVFVSMTPNRSVRGIIRPVLLTDSSRQISVLQFDQEIDFVREMHDTLKDLWFRRQSSAVITRTASYENMILARVSAPFDQPGGASFFLDFKQIKTVTSSTVRAPKPLEKRGAPSTKKGAQATKPDKDGVRSQSLLFKGLSALGVDLSDVSE